MTKPKFYKKRVSILTGSDLSVRRLAYLELNSAQPGPTLWLTACMHGDEVGGIAIIHEVFSILKKTNMICGKLCAFPLMNPMAFEVGLRNIPLSNEDLNRAFPGNQNGTIGEKVAYKIFNTIVESKPTLVLDLHNDWIRSIPYAVLDSGKIEKETSFKETLAIGKKIKLPLVREPKSKHSDDLMQRTLTGNLLQKNIPALTLELGTSQMVDETQVSLGVNIILEIMIELGMLSMKLPDISYIKNQISKRIYTYHEKPFFTRMGLIRFLVRPGQIVKKGEVFANLYDVYGKIVESLQVENNSLVLGCNDSSVGIPGRPVVAFALILFA